MRILAKLLCWALVLAAVAAMPGAASDVRGAASDGAAAYDRTDRGNEEYRRLREKESAAFGEFLDAMSTIKSRYVASRERRDQWEMDRKGPPPPPGRDASGYGPDFAGLPLEVKLKIMQENSAAKMAEARRRQAERMNAYSKELGKKRNRLEKEIENIPDVLVRSGESPELVERFAKEWLLPDVSYRRQLAGAYFESELAADEAQTFLREVFGEFKGRRAVKGVK